MGEEVRVIFKLPSASYSVLFTLNALHPLLCIPVQLFYSASVMLEAFLIYQAIIFHPFISKNEAFV